MSAVSLPINVQPWLKYTATTVGRDKIYRGIQYFSRFLAWYLLRQGYTKETVARFNSLKKTLGLSRKRKSHYQWSPGMPPANCGLESGVRLDISGRGWTALLLT